MYPDVSTRRLVGFDQTEGCLLSFAQLIFLVVWAFREDLAGPLVPVFQARTAVVSKNLNDWSKGADF